MRLNQLLKSKIHHARVTYADPDYVGSIEIDRGLMRRVGMVDGELVQVWDVTNGERFETYAIQGDTGVIGVLGAAARRVAIGDKLIIVSFVLTDEPVTPKVILVDEHNAYVRDVVPSGSGGQATR
jgi:aspartate 1-decarboxylase